MRVLETFLGIAFLICLVGWSIATDFEFIEILSWLVLGGIMLIIPVILLIIAIWVVLEIFR